MKLSRPKEKLAQNNQAWVEDFSQGAVRLIGAAEVLGAVGLVLPALTGAHPWLTPVAALGLALLMAGAVYTHLRRKEGPAFVPPSVLLLLAAFVAVGRFFIPQCREPSTRTDGPARTRSSNVTAARPGALW
jgi:VIT1/CCC1 family predicted Fe2+/Mn2+ transporter